MNFVLALLTAALLILTFPRANLTWLAPIALTPLLFSVARESRPLRRFILGYVAGVGYWFGVCYWIQFVLAVHGGMGEAVGWAVFALFCLAKAMQMGAFALLAGIALRRSWGLPAVASLWVAIEATHGPMGFAWLTLGNAGIDMSVPMRLAPYTGVYGLSFVFAMLSAGLTLAIMRRPRAQLAWLLPLPLCILLPKLPAPQRGDATAVLVQPYIAEDEQWTPQSFARLEQRLTLLSKSAFPSNGNPPDILVWPEVPAPFYDNDPELHRLAAGLAHGTKAGFLLGVVGHAPDGAILNSALLISPSGSVVSRYDKVNLVPFGEFVPWPLGALTRKISTEVGDFRQGTQVVVSDAAEQKIGTFICYESVFPNFIRRFAANGAQVLFNLSNDSWFGKTAARFQHLEIVRMRAAENRRWILRATNNGITASIDPAGRLKSVAASYTELAYRVGYEYIRDTTVYTEYGDWFVWLCAILSLGGCMPRIAPQKFEAE